ncbi:hypothetical protein [uncultured Arcobacter sp.]|nr:hypothetical protein [uncultured Arcobacter sp.]
MNSRFIISCRYEFIIDEIQNLTLLDIKFEEIRDGYNPNDSRMSRIYITI